MSQTEAYLHRYLDFDTRHAPTTAPLPNPRTPRSADAGGEFLLHRVDRAQKRCESFYLTFYPH